MYYSYLTNFPDLQGENRGCTPHAGWYQNEFLLWIQSQDPKKHDGFTIGMFLLAGKFGSIITDFQILLKKFSCFL